MRAKWTRPTLPGEPALGIADHEPEACQASLPEGGDELRPEGLGLAVAHLEPEQLTAPVLVHPHGDDDGAGADLLSLAQSALEVGGIEVDASVATALQRAAQEHLHLLVDLLTVRLHLRVGDAALGAQSRHQRIFPHQDALMC